LRNEFNWRGSIEVEKGVGECKWGVKRVGGVKQKRDILKLRPGLWKPRK